ncbi:unnamed protein product [Cuscuta epithymum]|uniref:Uncharacterized protein n=1 Tax=Cuscuta epithymum TaxID=186058 RepID=A0AAV0CMP9_9ASTE|nr:unnamed protein product [Cuscuta epithymum]
MWYMLFFIFLFCNRIAAKRRSLLAKLQVCKDHVSGALCPHKNKKVQVLTIGALHQIDCSSLQSAASAWHEGIGLLPKPLLVVNIGGPTSHCKYGEDLANELTSSLQNVIPTCGSVRISFSRRTPKMVKHDWLQIL